MVAHCPTAVAARRAGCTLAARSLHAGRLARPSGSLLGLAADVNRIFLVKESRRISNTELRFFKSASVNGAMCAMHIIASAPQTEVKHHG